MRKFAIALLRLVVADTMDNLTVEWPLVQWKLYEDDLSIKQRARVDVLAKIATKPVASCIQAFKKLDLDFSLGEAG